MGAVWEFDECKSQFHVLPWGLDHSAREICQAPGGMRILPKSHSCRQRGCGDHSCLVANCPCGVEELNICEGLRTAFLQGWQLHTQRCDLVLMHHAIKREQKPPWSSSAGAQRELSQARRVHPKIWPSSSLPSLPLR